MLLPQVQFTIHTTLLCNIQRHSDKRQVINFIFYLISWTVLNIFLWQKIVYNTKSSSICYINSVFWQQKINNMAKFQETLSPDSYCQSLIPFWVRVCAHNWALGARATGIVTADWISGDGLITPKVSSLLQRSLGGVAFFIMFSDFAVCWQSCTDRLL